MSATTETVAAPSGKVRAPAATPLATRVRVRLRRHKLDKRLAAGDEPNLDPLLRERARELVGDRCRRQVAESLELLLEDAGSGPRAFSSRVPPARAAIRDSRADLEAIVARLRAPAYISSQGVAWISLLLGDGASPLYGTLPTHPGELRRALRTVLDAIDHGPVLVG
jgi:hypothetical protein